MAIEYREEIEVTREIEARDRAEDEWMDESIGLGKNKEVVKLTKQEIDNDYENLDLSKF